MDYNHSDDEERPSIIQEVVFYDKPGVSTSREEDFFDNRRKSQRVRWPKPMVKSEPEELILKSELNIKSENFDDDSQEMMEEAEVNDNFIVNKANEFSENVVEILPSDVSDNTRNKKIVKRVEGFNHQSEHSQLRKGLKVYGRKTRKIIVRQVSISAEKSAQPPQKTAPERKKNKQQPKDLHDSPKRPRGRPRKYPKKVEQETKISKKRKASVSGEISFQDGAVSQSPLKKKPIEKRIEYLEKSIERRKQMLVARLEPVPDVIELCTETNSELMEVGANEAETDKEIESQTPELFDDSNVFQSEVNEVVDSQKVTDPSNKLVPVNIISVQTIQRRHNLPQSDHKKIRLMTIKNIQNGNDNTAKQYDLQKKPAAPAVGEKSGGSSLQLEINKALFKKSIKQSPQKSPASKQSQLTSPKKVSPTTDGDESQIVTDKRVEANADYPEEDSKDEWIPIESQGHQQEPSTTVDRSYKQSPQKSPTSKKTQRNLPKKGSLTTDGDEFKIVTEKRVGASADYRLFEEDSKSEWIPIESVGRQQEPSARVYRCEQCKQDFLTKDDLASHIEESEHTTSMEYEVILSSSGVEMRKVIRRKQDEADVEDIITREQDEADIEDIEDDDRVEWIPQDYAEYRLKHLESKKKRYRVHKCKICLSIFKSYYLLCKHKVIHLTKKHPYECRQCDDTFEEIESFTAHIRMHQGKNPYPCKKCEMGFMTKEELEQHSQIHILKKNPPKVKRFRCDICGKEFSKLCDMERHTRVHTGEKPAECNICHKRFQQTHNLSKHLLTHLQVKPFQCDLCNKKFGRIDVLNRHLLTHSLDKPFKCTVCAKGFIRLVQYESHMSKSHPEVECAENEASTLNLSTTKGMPKSQPEDQFEEDPDNDLEIQEESVDIVPVDEMDPDVPEQVDLEEYVSEDSQINEEETEMEEATYYGDGENIQIIQVEDLRDAIERRRLEQEAAATELVLNEEPYRQSQRRVKRKFLKKDNEYFEAPQSPVKSSRKIIIRQIHELEEQIPHTTDPNVIMERILNPQEDVREQIIEEIN